MTLEVELDLKSDFLIEPDCFWSTVVKAVNVDGSINFNCGLKIFIKRALIGL